MAVGKPKYPAIVRTVRQGIGSNDLYVTELLATNAICVLDNLLNAAMAGFSFEKNGSLQKKLIRSFLSADIAISETLSGPLRFSAYQFIGGRD